MTVLVVDDEPDARRLIRRMLEECHATVLVAGSAAEAIALTAFARSEDRTRALRAGFAVHVSKPVEPSELIAAVASAAGRTLGSWQGLSHGG
ncbi:MAG: two-component hybrid sensor and regulator [Phycisphaerales bacterium]|nr:two-component hybrid sensor and regulator [Phycisphaerales bacterium]